MAKRVGNYDVEAKLGGGALGSVFRATHVASGDTVAMRILDPKLATDETYAELFVAQARAAMRVEHQNVCKVRDAGLEAGALFVVTDRVDGVSLEDLLRKSGRLQAARAIEYLRQAALALSAIHGFGMTHGRIKPSNIMVTRDAKGIKLTDFGVARPPEGQLQQAELGLAGAPYYMAPELGKGLPPTMHSDLYALGATFYHLLAGTPPFTGPHATAVLMKHAGEKAIPLRELDPSVPSELSGAIERLMAKEPADRPADPRDVIKDLAAPIRLQDTATGPKVRAIAAPKKGKTSATVKRVGTVTPKPRKATGGGRVVAGPRKKSPSQLYAMIGGGVLIVLALVLLLIFGREDPAISELNRCMDTARAMILKRDPATSEEASQMLRDAVARLPNTAAAKLARRSAEKVIVDAERFVFAATRANVDHLVAAVRKGEMKPAEAEAAFGQVEARYAQPGVPEVFRERMTRFLAEARTSVTAATVASTAETEAEAVEPGDETTAVDGIRGNVLELVEQGHYAEALGLVDAILGVAEGETEKREAEELRQRVVSEAGVGFALLARQIGKDADAKQFEQARRRLEAVRADYDFEPYRKRFQLALENLQVYMSEQKPQPAPPPAPKPPERRDWQKPPAPPVVAQPEPQPPAPPAPPPGADTASAEEAIVKAIDSAVSLVGEDKKAEALRLMKSLQPKYGSTAAYKSHKEEIEALIQMASD